MTNGWIALIATVIVAIGIMVLVGGDDTQCGTYTTKRCGPGDLRPPPTPPLPPSMR